MADKWAADMDRLIAEMRRNPTRYVAEARKDARKGTLTARSATTGRFVTSKDAQQGSRRRAAG